MKRSGTYYLNNTGHRWVVYKNGEKERVRVLYPDGFVKTRAILYYESFGNFAVMCISVKGKMKKFLPGETFLPNGDLFRGIILKPEDLL